MYSQKVKQIVSLKRTRRETKRLPRTHTEGTIHWQPTARAINAKGT